MLERVGADRLAGCASWVRPLLEEAFPAEERPPWSELERDIHAGTLTLWVEESDGFMLVRGPLLGRDDHLLEYFAVAGARRSSGVGSLMLAALTSVLAAPIVFEIEQPGDDPRTVDRWRFYERAGARRIPHTSGYAMPDLRGPGVVPMWLLDLVPGRRDVEWTPEEVRELVTSIWTTSYGAISDLRPRLAEVLAGLD